MNYDEALKALKGRATKKVANNTYLVNHAHPDNGKCESGQVDIQLHGYPIIKLFPNGYVILSTCGWRTLTTKDRLNNFAPGNVRLRQKSSKWYLQDGNEFHDDYSYYAPNAQGKN